jgi:hypothetical protein
MNNNLSLLLTTFNKYPLNHNINYKKVNKFIELADPDVKDICRKIIMNTDHISFENFLKRLNICINELLNFIDINKTIYIIIDIVIDKSKFWLLDYFNNDNIKYKYKSNFWLFEYVKQYINYKSNFKRNIVLLNNINNNILNNNDTIIFIDDCIYSGNQMGETIQYMNNSKKLKLNFFILVPFISTTGKANIIHLFNKSSNRKNYCKLIFPKLIFKPKRVKDVLNQNEILVFKKYYSEFQFIDTKCLIYFDHKLADTASTLTFFYLGIVPNQKNLSIFKNIKIFDLKNYLQLLDIVPFINKCDKYKYDIDINSPKCPAPPYKKNFNKFIDLYKKEISKYKSLSIPKSSSSLKPIKYKSH